MFQSGSECIQTICHKINEINEMLNTNVLKLIGTHGGRYATSKLIKVCNENY